MRKARKEATKNKSILNKKIKKDKAKNAGITLMSLVITIIILLILASI